MRVFPKGSTGYLVGAYHLRCLRAGKVTDLPLQPLASPRDVFRQRRQVHGAVPRTSRAISRAEEGAPVVRAVLADDESGANSLRKRACPMPGTQKVNTEVVLPRLRWEGACQTRLVLLRPFRRAPLSGQSRVACRARRRRQSEKEWRSLCQRQCVFVTMAKVSIERARVTRRDETGQPGGHLAGWAWHQGSSPDPPSREGFPSLCRPFFVSSVRGV
jgi:hypothetical protein